MEAGTAAEGPLVPDFVDLWLGRRDREPADVVGPIGQSFACLVGRLESSGGCTLKTLPPGVRKAIPQLTQSSDALVASSFSTTW